MRRRGKEKRGEEREWEREKKGKKEEEICEKERGGKE